MFYVPQILRLAQKQGTSLSQDNLSLKLFIVQFIPLFQDEWRMCRAYLFLKSWTASPKWAISVSKQIISKIFWNHWLRKWFWKKKAGDNCPRNNMNRYDLTSLLPLSVFFYTIYAAIDSIKLLSTIYYLLSTIYSTERHKILQNFWRLSIILSCDRVVWSSCWE